MYGGYSGREYVLPQELKYNHAKFHLIRCSDLDRAYCRIYNISMLNLVQFIVLPTLYLGHIFE